MIEYWPHALFAVAVLVIGVVLGLLVGHDLRLEKERMAGKASGTCLVAMEVGHRYAARGDSALSKIQAMNARAGTWPTEAASAASK